MDNPNMTGPYDPCLHISNIPAGEFDTELQTNTVKNKAAGAEAAALSTQVDPKYIIPRESLKLGRVIGRGTFGTVQIAEWGAKSLVAVKCIPWDDDADNANVRKQMVLREINMLCNLHYPNVVTFYGVCESAKTLMLVQELCTGGNLRNIMRRRQEFLDQNKINFMHQIACAMEYLHGKGVIHRDLKPENVLLGGHGANTCKLCDFGLARPNDAADKMATMTVGVGTALYMAPEVLQEANGTTARVEADGDKCDVFSGAIMFVEMLRPNTDIYPGEPTMTVSYKVLHQNLRPKFPSGVQPAIADLISEMWVHDPSSRPCYAEVARRISEIAVEES
jgi:serine/threonine protein kinase